MPTSISTHTKEVFYGGSIKDIPTHPVERINMLQALKTGFIYPFYLKTEHVHTAGTKASALIHSTLVG